MMKQLIRTAFSGIFNFCKYLIQGLVLVFLWGGTPFVIFTVWWVARYGSFGMEWIDERGFGNGKVRQIHVEGKPVVYYRFDNYWTRDNVYRIEFDESWNWIGGVVTISATKKDKKGEVLFSAKTEFDVTRPPLKHGDRMIVLPTGWSPASSGETLDLDIGFTSVESDGNDVRHEIKQHFKSKRVFYFPSV